MKTARLLPQKAQELLHRGQQLPPLQARHPQGKERDDFFCTTDPAAKPEDVVSWYA